MSNYSRHHSSTFSPLWLSYEPKYSHYCIFQPITFVLLWNATNWSWAVSECPGKHYLQISEKKEHQRSAIRLTISINTIIYFSQRRCLKASKGSGLTSAEAFPFNSNRLSWFEKRQKTTDLPFIGWNFPPCRLF